MAAIEHLIVAGQSLAVGGQGTPPITTVAPYPTNVTVVGAGGVRTPRYEGTGSGNGGEGNVETIGTQMGRKVYEHYRDDRLLPSKALSVNVHGLSGTPYTGLKKGTTTYNTSVNRAALGSSVANSQGDRLVCTAVHVIHGETDEGSAGTSRAQYLADLREWITDYDADLRAATGQTERVRMLISQLGRWENYGTVPEISLAQIDAHRVDPSIVMIGPKYQLPRVDGIHLTPAGYYWLGQLHARVHNKVVVDGQSWQPVAPISIQRIGLSVVVRFSVPAPPLVWDTTLVTAQASYGFRFLDNGAVINITDAVLSGPDEVTLTLQSAPTSPNEVLTYAAKANSLGNLRDSEPFVSDYGAQPLPNWCVQFSDPVGFSYTPPADPIILPPALVKIHVQMNKKIVEADVYVMTSLGILAATEFGPKGGLG